MSATKDFEELLASLRSHGVRAVVVGGHAVAFHARPRFTKDIDILVEPTDANAKRLLAALEEFGFGLSFEEVWAGRVDGRFGDQSVSYIGKSELIRNKEAVARPQDLLDLAWLRGS